MGDSDLSTLIPPVVFPFHFLSQLPPPGCHREMAQSSMLCQSSILKVHSPYQLVKKMSLNVTYLFVKHSWRLVNFRASKNYHSEVNEFPLNFALGGDFNLFYALCISPVFPFEIGCPAPTHPKPYDHIGPQLGRKYSARIVAGVLKSIMYL